MSKPYLFIILIALFLITGCTQTTLAEAEEQTKPIQTGIPSVEPKIQSPIVITPKPDVKLMDLTTVEMKQPPTLTAVPTTQATQLTATPITTDASTTSTVFVNGIPTNQFVLMPPETIANSQQILLRGQSLGRNLHQFSKIGDSIVDTEQFFVPFDDGNYSLGEYQFLQNTVTHYAGAYRRFGFALRDGLNSTAVLDPMWADKTQCLANETPLACEIRLNNPSLLLIHFGTNDWTGTFEDNMREIIEYTINKGIVPVLITKANRVEATNERNDILRRLAAEYHIPLWDFDLIANTLPERGLAEDNAHLTISTEFDYAMSETIFQGYKAFNLSGLIFLERFLHQVVIPTSST